jgi:murein DD-endopeptidase MepM/ murein hydrolase activator NlpD
MAELAAMRRKDRLWHVTPYTIRSGDNIWSIARKFKTDHRLIIKANDITNPDMLRAGKRINVPNREGVMHKINRKDTLSSIARAYAIPVQKIREHNKIAGNTIKAGTLLFIPDAKPLTKKIEKIHQQKNTVSIAKEQEERPRKKFQWPLEGTITSSFGRRISPISGKRSFHTGLDIGCPMDTPVKAAADGKVIFSGWKEVFGNMVIIKHDEGFITVYGHHRENLVKEDDIVKAGDVIAKSGTSGASTGPHLHFEIRKHLTPLNPIRLLR